MPIRNAPVPRPLRVLLPPLCLVVTFVAAGCGGGDKALTKAEYVKQADQICKDSLAQQSKLGTPKTAKDIVTLAGKTKPIVQDELKRLRALKAPDELKDNAKATYDLLDQQVPKIDELATAAKANDIQQLQSIVTSAGQLNKKATAKGKQLGLKVCAQG